MAGLKELIARQSAKRVEIRRIEAQKGQDGHAESTCSDATEDFVATEEPLEIRLGFSDASGERAERSISITMRTPGNDDELAIGFLFTEGIVRQSGDIQLVRPCGPPAPNGLINVVRVELADNVGVELDRLQRNFYTSSSCGVCGKASLDAVAVQGSFDTGRSEFGISRDRLEALPAQLAAKQAVFGRTGGLHASGLFDAGGELLTVREDVGRHNALDKLIGSRFRAGEIPLTDRGILVSGRASFELMQKAMVAGCPFVAAVGAPSSLAVELAEEFGMTLVGFLSRGRFNIYSRPERVVA